MNKKLLTLLGASLIVLSGCATTDAPANDTMVAKSEAPADKAASEQSAMPKEAEMSKDIDAAEMKYESEDPSKKGIVKTFSSSQDDTHAAAVAAMKQLGFKIKENEPDLLAGKRSNKIGVMVGSGGEKMKIALESIEGGSTRVHVRTKKTFVGIAGQKNWDDEIIGAMMAALAGS